MAIATYVDSISIRSNPDSTRNRFDKKMPTKQQQKMNLIIMGMNRHIIYVGNFVPRIQLYDQMYDPHTIRNAVIIKK